MPRPTPIGVQLFPPPPPVPCAYTGDATRRSVNTRNTNPIFRIFSPYDEIAVSGWLASALGGSALTLTASAFWSYIYPTTKHSEFTMRGNVNWLVLFANSHANVDRCQYHENKCLHQGNEQVQTEKRYWNQDWHQ